MKKIIIMILVSILLLNIVEAVSSDGAFRNFDFEGDCVDSTGTENCVPVGGCVYNTTTGFFAVGSSSLFCDGNAGSYLDSKWGNGELNHQTTVFSISFWLKLKSAFSDYDPAFGTQATGATNEGILFRKGTGTSWQWIQDEASNIYIEDSAPLNVPFSTSDFKHIVVTYNGDTTAGGVRIYVDGVLDETVTNNSDTSPDSETITHDLIFLARWLGSTGASNSEIDAWIDDLTLFNVTLTDSDVSDLYNGGAGLAWPFSAPNDPPQANDIGSNATNNSKSGDDIFINASFSDDTALSSYILSTNQTGSWVNGSSVSISGTAFLPNETVSISASQETSISFQYHVNDSSNAFNETEILTIIVGNDTRQPKFTFRRSSTKADILVLYDNGDMEITGDMYGTSFIENTKPYLENAARSYTDILDMDVSSKRGIHTTGPSECAARGGTDIPCLVKAVIKSMQEVSRKFSRIQNQIFTLSNEFVTETLDLQYKNRVLQAENKKLQREIGVLKQNVYEILVAERITIDSFNTTDYGTNSSNSTNMSQMSS